jgi:hypothetical protein
MRAQIRDLQKQLQRWRKQLGQLESGEGCFGTRKPGASLQNWKGATNQRITELRADIAVSESAVKEFERLEQKGARRLATQFSQPRGSHG